MTQRLEGDFSFTMKQLGLYHMKLQNNPLAQHPTPADFLVSTDLHLYLVECKQVTCKNGKGAFGFDKLTQEQDLIIFQKSLARHKSYLLLMYYDGTLKKSDIYLLPIQKYLDIKSKHKFNSINREAIKDYDTLKYKLNIFDGGELDLTEYFE